MDAMERLQLDVFTPGWKNCEQHCWCAYDVEDYPEWAGVIVAMKVIEHDHGDTTMCSGCMIADGKIVFCVYPARGSFVTEVVLDDFPPSWKEGDPAPPDATYLFFPENDNEPFR